MMVIFIDNHLAMLVAMIVTLVDQNREYTTPTFDLVDDALLKAGRVTPSLVDMLAGKRVNTTIVSCNQHNSLTITIR